mmetsp:Transcript_126152/g.315333  ORF Transcript_126152/g.315333 Transcript_126152/m.315333 type:complete len:233 (+) Transcript_126152:472-1170(+)
MEAVGFDHLREDFPHGFVLPPGMQEDPEDGQVIRDLVEAQLACVQLLQAGVEALPVPLLHESPKPLVARLAKRAHGLGLVRHVAPQELRLLLRGQSEGLGPPHGLPLPPRGLHHLMRRRAAVRPQHLHVVLSRLLRHFRRRRAFEGAGDDALQPKLPHLLLRAERPAGGCGACAAHRWRPRHRRYRQRSRQRSRQRQASDRSSGGRGRCGGAVEAPHSSWSSQPLGCWLSDD